MGCLYYLRKQTSVSYAADCDVVVCYGAATVYDKHLAAAIRCVDDEIIGWLKRAVSAWHDQHLVALAKTLTDPPQNGPRQQQGGRWSD